MATSSKRFMIIAIFTDLLLVLLLAMLGGADNPLPYMTTESESLINFGEQVENTYDNTIIDEGSTVLDRQFGNPVGMGKQLLSLFTTGSRFQTTTEQINCPDCPDETTGGMFLLFFALYFAVIHILAVYEVFQIIWGKKTD